MYLGEEFLGHIITQLNIWGTFQKHHFTFPSATYEVSNFPHPCQCLFLPAFLIMAILTHVKWYLLVPIISHFNFVATLS